MLSEIKRSMTYCVHTTGINVTHCVHDEPIAIHPPKILGDCFVCICVCMFTNMPVCIYVCV